MTPQPPGLSLEDFIAWEARQETKHEFVLGDIFAFAGGTKRHAAIAIEILALLHAHLRESPCQVYGSDVLIVTPHSGRYADVLVTCDERDTSDPSETAVHYPKLIVEVLSDSTAAVDRGDKLDEYRSIETLEEYVLIDSRRRWVETYRRAGATWIALLPASSGEVELTSVSMTITIDGIYSASGVSLLPGFELALDPLFATALDLPS